MSAERADKVVAWTATGVVLVTFLWLWGAYPSVALWPMLSATASVVAAMVLWTDLVSADPHHAWWALGGGAVVVAELWAEYLLLPTAAWPGQLAVWFVVILLATVASWRDRGGWRTGLRVGLGAAMVALVGQTLIFGLELGQPVQATVLEAQGMMARFEASHATAFGPWSVGSHWSDKPLVLAFGAGLGSVSGWVVGLVRRPPKR